MFGIETGMTIDDLLKTDHARRTYEHLCAYYTDAELKKFMFIISDYCNERSFYQRILDELEDSELVVDVTNNKCKTNQSNNKLTQLLNESSKRILAIQKELKLTPKASGGKAVIDASDMDVD